MARRSAATEQVTLGTPEAGGLAVWSFDVREPLEATLQVFDLTAGEDDEADESFFPHRAAVAGG